MLELGEPHFLVRHELTFPTIWPVPGERISSLTEVASGGPAALIV